MNLISTENKNLIVLISEVPILNPEKVAKYPELSLNYSIYLNTLLFSNWVEILSPYSEFSEIFYFLDGNDKDYLPKYFLPENTTAIFYNQNQHIKLSESILKYISIKNSKTLILFNNSIGLKQNEIIRIFNLVQSDEPSIVIGKTGKDQIIFVCTLGFNKELIEPIFLEDRKYSKYLNSITDKDIFLNTLDNYLSINDFEDIKKLYIELSKKESLSFCSQKMHESFNDLFIEYKELLNV